MKYGIVRTCLLLAAALSAALAAVQPPGLALAARELHAQPDASIRTLHFTRGEAVVVSSSGRDDANQVTNLRRFYSIYNGDAVVMGRAGAGRTLQEACAAEFFLPAGSGTIRWYDPDGQLWHAAALSPFSLRAGCAVVTMNHGGEALFYTPKVYEPQGAGTLRYLPELDGSLEIQATKAGWRIRLAVPALPEGCFADYTAVFSCGSLFEGPEVLDAYWRNYTLDTEGKWCFDGYYFPSPGTYSPTGENCLYRLPAAYLCKSFAYGAPSVRAAEDLAAATLDTMLLQQNALGYFPTLPESQWLSDSYGMGGGFYDTRFNTDLTEIYTKFDSWAPCAEFDAALNRYFSFFLEFASAHHTETSGGGWLVEDYWSPGGGRKTHTSLNHQLAEILTLYRSAERLSRPDLSKLADRMLQAVCDTASGWIRSDGNLHYAVYADGSFGGEDYPYLTYNDLYSLRQYLQAHGRSVPELQALMDAKLAWMQANGVTGYLS